MKTIHGMVYQPVGYDFWQAETNMNRVPGGPGIQGPGLPTMGATGYSAEHSGGCLARSLQWVGFRGKLILYGRDEAVVGEWRIKRGGIVEKDGVEI